jgi:hypothetical protein
MSSSSTLSAKQTILEEAGAAVDGSRQENYGHPAEDFARIASYWSTHLNGIGITPHDVALMMMMVKLSRLHNTPYHRDSLVDIAGYARCAEKIVMYHKGEAVPTIEPLPVKDYR